MSLHFNPILHFVFNPKSGHGKGADIFKKAQSLCAEMGWTLQSHEIKDPSEIETVMKSAADACFKDQGTLAASGGDGTLRAAVQAIEGRDIRFAAIPGGTFNLFARTHQIPEDTDDALKLIFQGSQQRIRVGKINDHVFLINANLGLYAKAIYSRKAHTRRWGRHRIVAILATVGTLLKGHTNMQVRIKTADQQMTLKTPMIFIGNNALQLEQMSLGVAKGMRRDDSLALFTMKPHKAWDMMRILFRGMAKTLDQDPSLESFNIDEATIEIKKKKALVSLDGEMFLLNAPLEVRAKPEHVLLVK
ncbi:hypothetical protein AZI86_04040 [Bdellovibrio bacteriovorus]|uniref:DAGKc domain-containing protein n=1 Tax=Bdellovibrio bacteriovorus TaxID=959 RepID=A0A150WPL3_BDEBC|nr:diacylglycerol kinase family protein [Bdellovibrio bacteriovorus]KYG66239.1 hypothetical protein AZI86_04040 [Bdellovibrio bacteriovorus]